jgi:hypothetical protein
LHWHNPRPWVKIQVVDWSKDNDILKENFKKHRKIIVYKQTVAACVDFVEKFGKTVKKPIFLYHAKLPSKEKEDSIR